MKLRQLSPAVRSFGWKRALAATFLASAFAMTTPIAQAQPPARSQPITLTGAETGVAVRPFRYSGNLRTLERPLAWQPGDSIREVPRRLHPRERRTAAPTPRPQVDPLAALQREAESRRATSGRNPSRALASPHVTTDGLGFTGVGPPDTNGAVGADHFIQGVNHPQGTLISIRDMDGVEVSQFVLETLGATIAPGTSCATSGFGDSIILFDEPARRWLLTEFTTVDSLCVYVSQTHDPIAGGWYLYEYATTDFPDYPKFGVWHDGYYVGTNESTPRVYVFDRRSMLSGGAAAFQFFDVPDELSFAFQMLLPADIDGPIPPAGGPAYFVRHNDDEQHEAMPNAGFDLLQVFEMSVDWDTPANSTFTGPVDVPVADFDSDVCGLNSLACIPQPGTAVRLDPVREVLMWRLQYRRWQDYQSLVGNYTVDVDGNDTAAVRWFELRASGDDPWTLFQEGSYSPDADHHWMAAIAMDGAGNMLMGMNAASSVSYPSLVLTGRQKGDPLNIMTAAKSTLGAGGDSNFSNRYGDYSALTVDPDDDCTFWLTGEYNKSGHNGEWTTRIGALRFDDCQALALFGDGFESGTTGRFSSEVAE